MVEVEFELAEDGGEFLEDLDAGTDDFEANAVTGDGGNFVDPTDIMYCTWRHGREGIETQFGS